MPAVVDCSLFRRCATYARKFGEDRLFRIARGAKGADFQWTDVLLREAARLMDGLSPHYYTVPGSWQEKGSATRFDEADWLTTLQKALFMGEPLEKHGAVMNKYDPRRLHPRTKPRQGPREWSNPKAAPHAYQDAGQATSPVPF